MVDPVSIWLVVVGGALAVLGGVVTGGLALATKHFESGHERKKRRAKKFEQLVTAVYELDHWLTSMRDKEVFGEEMELGLNPTAKIEAIAAVHFPNFNEPIQNLVTAIIEYQAWMLQAKKKRLDGDVSNANEGLSEAYRPYRSEFVFLLKGMREFAAVTFR